MDLALPTVSSISFNFFEYDVFIRFRGEDTRKNFVSHLYKELCSKEIKVYIDEQTLEKGEEISSALLQAIQKSKISLIIFSENYASSTWCLDELVHILKCREEDGQIVVPIFYGVDPSHARKQEESFAHAFVAHQQRFVDKTEKLHEWRAALERACNISGWDSRDRYESKLIEEIVENVVSTLSYFPSRTTEDFEDLVGIIRPLKEVEQLLDVGSPDVLIIGICGMGGIGKTTLARVVFHRFSSQFLGCCFLQNVREESKAHGLDYLQYQLLSKLLEEEDINRDRIQQKKVLIVLDDVDDLNQLQRLGGDRTWFGSGTRIITTTRNKQLLRLHAVDEIYEVEGLNFDEALQLFSCNAFRGRPSSLGYARLSQLVVPYTHGIPLALKVLGSFFYGRSMEEWESALEKLKRNPLNDIFQVLRVCYDGLNEVEKEVLLDIACSISRRGRNFVKEELDDVAGAVIPVLIDKSLISIEDDVEIRMHDSKRVMARNIVRRSAKIIRMHDWKLEMILGLEFISTKMRERSHWSSIKNEIEAEGRFFDKFDIDYEELPVRPGNSYYNSCEYPPKPLATRINPHNLVELDMPGRELKQYWNEVQDMSSSTTVGLIVSYGGKWRNTRGRWRFDGQKTKGMVVSKDIAYHELVEKLCRSLMVDQSQHNLDMRYLVDLAAPSPPIEIQDDDDVKFFIGEISNKVSPRFPLCITLVKKVTGQRVLVDSSGENGGIGVLLRWGRKFHLF